MPLEESEYRATYRELAQNRCVFEKALTNNLCRCSLARHFWLADREGYACTKQGAADNCGELLSKLRKNSRFALKLQDDVEILPHNMEIRVQAGGVRGLSATLAGDDSGMKDIHGTLNRALQNYGSIDSLPFSDIMPSVSAFKVRRRRSERRDRKLKPPD